MMPGTGQPKPESPKQLCPFCKRVVEGFLYQAHLLTMHGLLVVTVPKFTGGAATYYVTALTEDQVKDKLEQKKTETEYAATLERERLARLKELERS